MEGGFEEVETLVLGVCEEGGVERFTEAGCDGETARP